MEKAHHTRGGRRMQPNPKGKRETEWSGAPLQGGASWSAPSFSGAAFLPPVSGAVAFPPLRDYLSVFFLNMFFNFVCFHAQNAKPPPKRRSEKAAPPKGGGRRHHTKGGRSLVFQFFIIDNSKVLGASGASRHKFGNGRANFVMVVVSLFRSWTFRIWKLPKKRHTWKQTNMKNDLLNVKSFKKYKIRKLHIENWDYKS